MNWFVQIVNGKTGEIVRQHGPCTESESVDWERTFQQSTLDSRNLYTRRYDEHHPPDPFNPPNIGTEMTIEELAKAISGDRPAHMQAENLAFVRMLYKVLHNGGVWGWPATATIWTKTERGFRRTA